MLRNFKTSKKNLLFFKKQRILVAYVLFLVLELLVFIKVSDLPSALGGWQQKTAELANLQVPTDNFYGPGAALLNLPFYLLSIDLTAAAIY